MYLVQYGTEIGEKNIPIDLSILSSIKNLVQKYLKNTYSNKKQS